MEHLSKYHHVEFQLVEVEEQIQAILKEGITEESLSPWMSPAVFVRKKNGDVWICID